MNRSRTIRLAQDLERRILVGLSCEWAHAVHLLPTELADRMMAEKPLFSLRPLRHLLGTYSEATHEIVLNRRFALTHPWDSVREVLVHETAHQLAGILADAGTSEPPHGRTFQAACRMLRANPRASGRYPTLRERLKRGTASDEDRLLSRIHKLMALAESQNPHEADAAMRKASELIGKHHIALIDGALPRHYVSAFVGRPALRHPRHAVHLARLLQEYYGVEGIWVSTFVVGKEKMGRVLEISGTEENVLVAAYVWDYVHRFIDARWRQFNADGRLRHQRKIDFSVGIIEGFRDALSGRSRHAEPAAGSLVRIEDPRLRAYLDHRYPRTVVTRGRPLAQDATVVAAGEAIGKQLTIPDGLPERAGTGAPRRLPGPGN